MVGIMKKNADLFTEKETGHLKTMRGQLQQYRSTVQSYRSLRRLPF